MATTTAPATAAPGSVPSEPVPRATVSTTPVAVVWCRQVDNEAESPGYTTVPEEFPGSRETLEVIRTVGHLTVNVADTHDYWDPDPSQPLSYYPNLFLYPAFGGRYICLGRMFLSTEDRPRLGMKTLVLDTAQLLASGDFGGNLLRWHASMGGPKREGARPPALPDPALYNLVGEGLIFHRGSTDPVVLVASDNWESTMQTILDLLRVMPASLISLGAILAFPYFLPQPKTNLHEFTEQVPLALALMRVPRAEAAGDRHAKRMASWESAAITLRDLTDKLPTPPKGRENVPLVLQYARDHQDAKLLPISQRVDLVETPRLKTHLADPDRQGGRDRRKEMWRIGTAMESAALLLQRARGRHVPVNVETAKRAQEYLQARLPESDAGPTAGAEPAVVAVPSSVGSPAGQVPPWLQKLPEPTATAPPAAPEVVPVSVSDDPSLLKAVAPAPLPVAASRVLSGAPPSSSNFPPGRSPMAAASPVPAAPGPVAPVGAPPVAPTVGGWLKPSAPAASPPLPVPPAPAAPPVLAPASAAAPPPMAPAMDPVALRAMVMVEVNRILDERAAAAVAPAPPVASALDDHLRADLEGRTDLKIQNAQQVANQHLATAVAAVEHRQNQQRVEQNAELEQRLREAVSVSINAELDRRFAVSVEPKIGELSRRVEDAHRATATMAQQQLSAQLTDEVDRRFAATIEPRIAELSRGLEETARTSTATSQQQLNAQLSAELDRRWATSVEPKIRELGQRLDDSVKTASAAGAEQSSRALTAALTAADARQSQARADQIAAAESRIRDAVLAQVPSQVDGRLSTAIEPRIGELARRIDDAVKASSTATREEARSELARAVEALRGRVTQAEEDLRASLVAQLDLHLREAEDREATSRQALEAKLDASLQSQTVDADTRHSQDLKDLELRLNLLVDGRSRETHDKVTGIGSELDDRLSAAVDERVLAAEARIGGRFEAQLHEAGESQVQSLADLQVRLQSYSDQRLREEQERERQKYIELLARMKTEVDSALARMVDSARFDSALREKIGRTLDVYRAESQRTIDARISTAEQQLRVDQTELNAHLARIEQVVEERRNEFAKLEESVHGEIDDLDRRTQILADRLVPVVRKTWLRVVELQKSGGNAEADLQLNQLRREVHRELQRVEAEVDDRTAKIRERMESAIANQGRVWLTLIRQLSQLTDDRRVIDQHRAQSRSGIDAQNADIAQSLEAIPGIYPPRGGDDDDPVNPLDPDPSEPTSAPASRAADDPATRRRVRRTTR